MKKLENRVRGLKAKREGKSWENTFESFCNLTGVNCIRIPDGCRSLGKFKLMRVKSPFDFVLGYGDKIACVDLKSFGSGKNLTHSQIDSNQLHNLHKISRDGIAGYVVNFRSIDKIVFFSATQMLNIMKNNSLSYEEGMPLGSSIEMDPKKLFF